MFVFKGFRIFYDIKREILEHKEISDKYQPEDKICLQKCLDQEVLTTFSARQISRLIHESNELLWSDVWLCRSGCSTYKRSFICCCAKLEDGENKAMLLGIELPSGYQIVIDEMDLSSLKKYRLTKREIEILKLISEGLSNVEIGKILYLSKHTINIHRTNIYKKLEINSVKQLMNMVYRGRSYGIK